MSSDGYSFFLDVSSQLLNKLMIITLQYDQNGWGNSKGVNSVSTQNQQCHKMLLFTRDSTFCFIYIHVYDTRYKQNLTKDTLK